MMIFQKSVSLVSLAIERKTKNPLQLPTITQNESCLFF